MKLIKELSATPWGQAQDVTELAPGMYAISTDRHGGIYLSETMRALMPCEFRSFKTWAGAGWYEEDMDLAVVILSFPWKFSDSAIQAAKKIVSCRPDYFTRRGALLGDMKNETV